MAPPSKPLKLARTPPGNSADQSADGLEFRSPYATLRGQGLWFIGGFDLLLSIAVLCVLAKLDGNLSGAAIVFVIVAIFSIFLLFLLQTLVLFARFGQEMIPIVVKRLRAYLNKR
jgi:hypothetical protein